MNEKTKMGARLKAARKNAGLTQQQVADKIPGAIFSRISNYERGDREPDLATIKALAKILGVTVSYLIGVPEMEELPVEERNLVLKYRRLDRDGKETLHKVAEISQPDLSE